jgi:hypothetical protein
MPMVLVTSDPSLNCRFEPEALRERLLSEFPGIKFDREEQFAKRIQALQDLPESAQPPPFIIDDIKRTAQTCGPAYAFEIDAEGIAITGNVRSVDAVFLMDDMPSKSYWERMVAFAESIDGGIVTTQETG